MTPDDLSPRTRAVGAAFKVVAAAAVALALVLLVRGDMRAQEQRDNIRNVLDVLVECTTDPAERKDATTKPGEDDCFVRAQNRTADAIGQIGDLTIIAACGAELRGDAEAIRQCVTDVATYIKEQQP